MDEPAPGPIRVLIAEDQALLRTSFAALAGAEPDLEVVGRAADGGAGPRPARHRRLRGRPRAARELRRMGLVGAGWAGAVNGGVFVSHPRRSLYICSIVGVLPARPRGMPRAGRSVCCRTASLRMRVLRRVWRGWRRGPLWRVRLSAWWRRFWPRLRPRSSAAVLLGLPAPPTASSTPAAQVPGCSRMWWTPASGRSWKPRSRWWSTTIGAPMLWRIWVRMV